MNNMRVKIIGSGSMNTAYNSASYLVDDDIIVDFPNGMCKYLFRLGIDPRKINNVLITHFHGDHYFDIPFYLLLKYRAENKKVNIFCSNEGKSKNDKILRLAFPNTAKKIKKEISLKYNFSSDFSINDYSITKLLVDHGNMKPAYGYIFSKKDNNFGFTGDTTLCESVEYMAGVCKYLFCDCMFIKGTSKHMGIDMLKVLCNKYPNCKFVVNHMEDSTREELKKLDIKNLLVPEDGTVIDIQ